MPAATLISNVPNFVSLEEHSALVASTPDSFNDIPPILRHKEETVSISFDPPLDGFSPQDAAKGTLFVTESVLAFMSTTGRGFQIEYPAITLHAVSRSQSSPSIYCQLDERAGNLNSAIDDDPDANDMRELSIIPPGPSSLEPIFEALSLCASLHPDKPSTSDDDMDDGFADTDIDFETFTGDEEQEFSEVGRAALAHLESIIDVSHNLTQDDDKNGEKFVNGHRAAED